MDTFSGQQLYDAFHEDYDAITERDARVYDDTGRLIARGRLLGLRLDDSGRDHIEHTRYRFGSFAPEVEWSPSQRIELDARV